MTEAPRSQSLLVTTAWLVVILPTTWGLSYTVKNAMKLFTAQPAASAPSTTAH
jgi:hypothetical protein